MDGKDDVEFAARRMADETENLGAVLCSNVNLPSGDAGDLLISDLADEVAMLQKTLAAEEEEHRARASRLRSMHWQVSVGGAASEAATCVTSRRRRRLRERDKPLDEQIAARRWSR